jgi:hypothetical protein
MTRFRMSALAAGAILALLAINPVAAAGATRVSITLNSFATETFTTTGGALCPSGTATTDFDKFGGSGNSRAGSFHLSKVLVCDDGSGTFTINVDAATVFGSPTDQGGWSVAGGTGAYATLHGGGNLVGTYVDEGIIDLYTGSVHT